MHSFRLRYIVLGLLIYLQNAFCRTCGSEFDDISSKALIADVVFEGTFKEKLPINNQNDVEYKAKFNVKKVFKGNLPKIRKRGKKYHPVVTGIFGYDGGEGCNTNVDTSKTFLMFLNASSFNNITQYYQVTALPEISNKQSRREVRNILCKDCDTRAKAPRGRLSPKEVTIHEGKRLNLRCKATGNPRPIVTWLKNGQKLTKSKKYRFKYSKSSSRLRINKVSVEDTGDYTCHIKNAVGEITKRSRVTVTSDESNVSTPEPPPHISTPETPSHAIPCQQQTLCLNGGTCYKVIDLNDEFCKCAPNFTGKRCTEKDPDISTKPDIRPSRDKRQFDRSMTILGLVIGVLALIAVCLAAFCMARKKKKEYRKKVAEKRRLQNATYTNGTHRPVSGTDDSSKEKARPVANIELKSVFPSAFDASTQTYAKWYDHMVVDNGVDRPPPSYSPNTPPSSSYMYQGSSTSPSHNEAGKIQAVSAPDVLGRPRLHAISATPDFDCQENRKPLANATVVSAVVESEPDHQTSVRSSPNQSQNSRTESEHGIPLPSSNSNNNEVIKKSDSDTDNVCPVNKSDKYPSTADIIQPPPCDNLENHNTIIDYDQQSDYDNQPSSDLEVNVESEADTQGLDDDVDSHLLQGEGQVDTADESDSESSATEEQALFQKLKSSRQGSVQSDLDGGFGGLFGINPSYINHQPNYLDNESTPPTYENTSSTLPSQYAFNPYAVDDELTGNNYFGNFGKPSKIASMPSRTSQNKLTGNDLILQNPLLFDPDPDATPV